MEDVGVDGKIIIKWILKKWEEETWTGLLWLSIGTGTFECSHEFLGSIRCLGTC